MNKQKRKIKGFTLIEIMVAVSIFAIVALIVSGAFITLANIFKKTQTNRAVVDNINLTMDTMALQIREGKNYKFGGGCSGSDGTFTCSSTIEFDEYVIEGDKYVIDRHLIYKKSNEGQIMQCLGVDSDDTCSALTSSEIQIKKLNFYHWFDSETLPPIVVIVVDGVAVARDNLKTEFTLQTTLSQRNYIND